MTLHTFTSHCKDYLHVPATNPPRTASTQNPASRANLDNMTLDEVIRSLDDNSPANLARLLQAANLPNDLCTIYQASIATGITATYIRKRIRHADIKAWRVGKRRLLFSLSDLIATFQSKLDRNAKGHPAHTNVAPHGTSIPPRYPSTITSPDHAHAHCQP